MEKHDDGQDYTFSTKTKIGIHFSLSSHRSWLICGIDSESQASLTRLRKGCSLISIDGESPPTDRENLRAKFGLAFQKSKSIVLRFASPSLFRNVKAGSVATTETF